MTPTFAFLEGNFAYSLLLGMLAAVNPCGFVLLPTYLVYYLGLEEEADPRQRLARALGVGGAVSAGFVGVFVVVGTISRLFTQWVESQAKYLALVIGLGLIVAGIFMLRGWKPSLWRPTSSASRSLSGMFVFGIIYAVASIGCTIGLLTTAVFGSIAVHGFVSGVISISLYGVGMGLFVTALTVAIAFAKTGLVTGSRRILRYIDKVSAVFVIITGVYLTWYWYAAITQRPSPGTFVSTVERWQSRLVQALQDVGAIRLAVVFIVIVAAAVVIGRRRPVGKRS